MTTRRGFLGMLAGLSALRLKIFSNPFIAELPIGSRVSYNVRFTYGPAPPVPSRVRHVDVREIVIGCYADYFPAPENQRDE